MVKKKTNTKRTKVKDKSMYEEAVKVQDDLFDRCVRKGLIEKTACGYYFTPEFFETLDIYDDD